jgi:hypothetical protein
MLGASGPRPDSGCIHLSVISPLALPGRQHETKPDQQTPVVTARIIPDAPSEAKSTQTHRAQNSPAAVPLRLAPVLE